MSTMTDLVQCYSPHVFHQHLTQVPFLLPEFGQFAAAMAEGPRDVFSLPALVRLPAYMSKRDRGVGRSSDTVRQELNTGRM